jgi:sulfur-carrier protein
MADRESQSVSTVGVRLWAGARAAAGVGELRVEVPGPVTVTWLREEVVRRHPAAERLPAVLAVCSVLVGDRPLGAADPATVCVDPGQTIEFLPPFAGG